MLALVESNLIKLFSKMPLYNAKESKQTKNPFNIKLKLKVLNAIKKN